MLHEEKGCTLDLSLLLSRTSGDLRWPLITEDPASQEPQFTDQAPRSQNPDPPSSVPGQTGGSGTGHTEYLDALHSRLIAKELDLNAEHHEGEIQEELSESGTGSRR